MGDDVWQKEWTYFSGVGNLNKYLACFDIALRAGTIGIGMFMFGEFGSHAGDRIQHVESIEYIWLEHAIIQV